MEKAVLKTIIYGDIFDYPLKINEIYKWLIGKKITIRQLEKTLKKLNQESRQRPASQRGERGSPKAARIKNKASLLLRNKAGHYFLPRRDELVAQRHRREEQSARYLKKAQILCQILKIIPWVKLVGISGGLAVNNASLKDDIDLFIITSKNRLWVCRLLALGLLSLIGQRRKVGDSGRKIAGKLCLNILLEEDKLEQKNKDIYVAHEVLQMKVLWQRDGIYSKYLEDNEWVFKFLPNWIGYARGPVSSVSRRASSLTSFAAATRRDPLLAATPRWFDFIEMLARKLQLKIMQAPKGMERIENGALYFHPKDCRIEVLQKYKKKLAALDK